VILNDLREFVMFMAEYGLYGVIIIFCGGVLPARIDHVHN
jgi:hypothetical protein